uniref:choice-of-anchor L domain-containing protein n=1 Tax=Flavobacterium sp. TaxID=239 RepID=UPI00404A5214
MKKYEFCLLLLLVCSPISFLKAQQITIDDTFSAQQLVEDVLINSPCANVSNFSVSGWDFDNSNKSYAYFTNGGSAFPFEDGVIITTGRSNSAIGPNTSLQSEGPATWQGDSDLEAAINESSSINATILEFDFLPLANKVSFEYIFSSEQYLSSPNANQCNFSDGFVFLLKEVGSQDQYENLAVVPGTNIPVKITTVRGSGTICPPANEAFFDAFNGTNHPTNFNGQTKILEAKANVTPGVLYHMKLVVADQGNQLFDSAIFLGGGSFKVEIDLGEDRLIANENPVCLDDTLILDATQGGNSNTYQWFRNGVILNGETNPLYEVVSAGEYSVEVTLENGGCLATGDITIEYGSGPIINDAVLEQCADLNGQAVFDLTAAQDAIVPAGTLVQNINYFTSLLDAENGTNAIPNPLNYTSISTSLFVRVVNNLGCASIANVDLLATINEISTLSLQFCDNDDLQDGIRTINLQTSVTPAFTDGLDPNFSIQYFSAIEDAYANLNSLGNQFSNEIPFSETIYAKEFENGNCLGITAITMNVQAFSNVDISDEVVVLCTNETVTLSVPFGYESYVWSNDETDSFIVVDEPGFYSVSIMSSFGCTTTKIFEVVSSELATIETITTTDFLGNNNSIQVLVSGNGNYQFSLNGFTYQNEPFFEGLGAGFYTIYVKNTACGVVEENVTLLGYPKFFTPNNDGVNDYWVINFLPDDAVIYIFNRFGKLLYSYTKTGIGWDGFFQNKPLPADDYWFILQYGSLKIFKAHFSLIR